MSGHASEETLTVDLYYAEVIADARGNATVCDPATLDPWLTSGLQGIGGGFSQEGDRRLTAMPATTPFDPFASTGGADLFRAPTYSVIEGWTR